MPITSHISILFNEFLYLFFNVSSTHRALRATENVVAVIENQFPVDFHVPLYVNVELSQTSMFNAITRYLWAWHK